MSAGYVASRRLNPGRKSVILDGIHPRDYRTLKFTYCCEQCVHFDGDKVDCSMGFSHDLHGREAQLRTYRLTGKMAICRFLEID
ncbi:MAG: hypothetical protein KDD43_10525 [Bdellovibrionales bacterium]|nr:hypothetical protein [Bdellovibrionales bacterium]